MEARHFALYLSSVEASRRFKARVRHCESEQSITSYLQKGLTRKVLEGGVVTAVEKEEDAEALYFWQQGNPDLYTSEMLGQRYSNRLHPDVWQVLHDCWWMTAIRSVPRASHDEPLPHRLPKEIFVRIMVLICKALLEQEEKWDYEEAVRLAVDTWKVDSRGLVSMNQTMFNDALFELADTWTLTCEVVEYVDFLKGLFHQVTRDDAGKASWKDVDSERVDSVWLGRRSSASERTDRRRTWGVLVAAIAIQRELRRNSQRRAFKAKKHGAVIIQAHARKAPVRRSFSALRGSAIVVQRQQRRQVALSRLRRYGLTLAVLMSVARGQHIAPAATFSGSSLRQRCLRSSRPKGVARCQRNLGAPIQPRYMEHRDRPPSALWQRKLLAEQGTSDRRQRLAPLPTYHIRHSRQKIAVPVGAELTACRTVHRLTPTAAATVQNRPIRIETSGTHNSTQWSAVDGLRPRIGLGMHVSTSMPVMGRPSTSTCAVPGRGSERTHTSEGKGFAACCREGCDASLPSEIVLKQSESPTLDLVGAMTVRPLTAQPLLPVSRDVQPVCCLPRPRLPGLRPGRVIRKHVT